MTRHASIRLRMKRMEELGVIVPGQSYTQGGMPGLRWTFVPAGHTERSLSTSQMEDFLLGAEAARFGRHEWQEDDPHGPDCAIRFAPVAECTCGKADAIGGKR